MAVVGYSEAAVGGLRDGHNLHETARLFKYDALRDTDVPLWLFSLLAGKLIIWFVWRFRQASADNVAEMVSNF